VGGFGDVILPELCISDFGKPVGGILCFLIYLTTVSVRQNI
jgi:hypothetical protein